MILHPTPSTAALVGETPAEWQRPGDAGPPRAVDDCARAGYGYPPSKPASRYSLVPAPQVTIFVTLGRTPECPAGKW